MLSLSGPYRTPAALMLVSAVLYLALLAIPGGPAFVGSVFGIAVHALVGIGLLRGRRWFAYIGFVVALIGGIAALATAAQGAAPLATLFWGIAVVDWLAAAWLLAQLWRSADPASG